MCRQKTLRSIEALHRLQRRDSHNSSDDEGTPLHSPASMHLKDSPHESSYEVTSLRASSLKRRKDSPYESSYEEGTPLRTPPLMQRRGSPHNSYEEGTPLHTSASTFNGRRPPPVSIPWLTPPWPPPEGDLDSSLDNPDES